MSKQVICMAGPARSGKDTCAEFIEVYLNDGDAERHTLALKLKDSLKFIFDLTDEHVYGALKESVIKITLPKYDGLRKRFMQALELGYLPNVETKNHYSVATLLMVKTMAVLEELSEKTLCQKLTTGSRTYFVSCRRLMQVWGTEIVRGVLGDTYWTDIVMTEIEKSDKAVHIITDCRFPVEVESAKKKFGNALVIRVQRGDKTVVFSAHSSEAGLPEEMIDYHIANNGTLEDLFGKVMNIVDKEIKHV